MKLLISLGAEIMKLKRTSSFYFTILGAAIVPLIGLLEAHDFSTGPNKSNVLNALLQSEMNMLVVFPIFVILICTLIPQVEHRNNAWKQIFTSPQRKATVYLAKFMSVHMLILLFIVVNHFFMFLSVIVIHFMYPELHVLQQPLNLKVMLINAANSYIFLLAICSIQFWLGLRFKNFVIPVAIGIVLWFFGMLLVLDFHSSSAKYFPYSLQISPYFGQLKSDLNSIGLISFGYAVLFLTLGFLDFRRRRLH